MYEGKNGIPPTCVPTVGLGSSRHVRANEE